MIQTAAMMAEQRVHESLWDGAMTRLVKIGTGTLATTGKCLDRCFPSGPVIVIADSNTYQAAGQAIDQHLRQYGREVLEPYVFEDNDLYAEYRFVERLQKFLAGTDATPVAVGSGTINDLTKLASHLCGRPYMVVGTAASMDGYTAFGASITRDGYKQTMSCPAPLAVVLDLDIIAQAPREMNAAGYADLIAKIPAGADWLLAEAAGVEPVERESWKLVQDNLREWVGDPTGIRRADRTALAGLVEGLVMTGLGMQRANSSRPASGADHQFSHLWDMQHHTHQGATPMHGCKVAIGTLASTAMHEQVLASNIQHLSTEENSIRTHWPEWEIIEQAIRNDFPDASLAEQVLQQSRDKYLKASELVQRLQRLKAGWPELCVRLRDQLIPASTIQEMLAQAGAPNMPEEIGISRQRLQKSYKQAQWIRSRYTVLDFILEAGWWTPCIDNLFKPGSFWGKKQESGSHG